MEETCRKKSILYKEHWQHARPQLLLNLSGGGSITIPESQNRQTQTCVHTLPLVYFENTTLVRFEKVD